MAPKKPSKARSKKGADRVNKVDWLDLPDDLWTEIAQRLPTRDLFAFSGVCKSFRRVTNSGGPGLWGPIFLTIDFNGALNDDLYGLVNGSCEEEECDVILIREQKGKGLAFSFQFFTLSAFQTELEAFVRWASPKIIGRAIDLLSVRVILSDSSDPYRLTRTRTGSRRRGPAYVIYTGNVADSDDDGRFDSDGDVEETDSTVIDEEEGEDEGEGEDAGGSEGWGDSDYDDTSETDSSDVDDEEAQDKFNDAILKLEREMVEGLIPLLDAASRAPVPPDFRYQVEASMLPECLHAERILHEAAAHCPAADLTFFSGMPTLPQFARRPQAFVDVIHSLPRSVTLNVGDLCEVQPKMLEAIAPVVATFESITISIKNKGRFGLFEEENYAEVIYSSEPPALSRLRLMMGHRPEYDDPFLRALADADQFANVTTLRIDVCRLVCSMRPSELQRLERLLSSLPKLTSLTMACFMDLRARSEYDLFDSRKSSLDDRAVYGGQWLHFKRASPGAPLALLPDPTRDRDPAHPFQLPEGPWTTLLSLLPPSVTSAHILTPEVNPFALLSLDWRFLKPRTDGDESESGQEWDDKINQEYHLLERLDLLRRLSQLGMRLDARHPENGATLLFPLCEFDRAYSSDPVVMAEAVRFLQENGHSVLATTKGGTSALHVAVIKSEKWVPVLLDACASDDERRRLANLRPLGGNTALRYALQNRTELKPTTMLRLICAGTLSILEAGDEEDEEGTPEIDSLLLSFSSRRYIDRPTLLMVLDSCSSDEGLLALLEELFSQAGNAEAAGMVDEQGSTLLMELLRNPRIPNGPELARAVRFLMDRGVDVHARDKETKETALHHAARKRSLQVCQALIEAGVDVTLMNRWSSTALDVAKDTRIRSYSDYNPKCRKETAELIELLKAQTKKAKKGKGKEMQDGAGAQGKGKGKGKGAKSKAPPPAKKTGGSRRRKGEK